VGWAGSRDSLRYTAASRLLEEQRQRFVELHMTAADEAGLPHDKPFRHALREHVEFGTHVAMQNSHAKSDTDLHPLNR
jgi:hemoglobin